MTRKPLVTRFHLLLLGALAAITATAFVKVNADVGLPVHWGFDGRPDAVWPKTQALLIFPLIGIVLFALFAAIGHFAPVEKIEPGRHISEALLSGLLLLLSGLQLALILIGVGSDIDLVRIIAFAVAALLVGFGVILPGADAKAYRGLRLPWSIGVGWSAIHRLAGVLLVAGGLILGAVAWLRPDPVDVLPTIGGAVLVPLLVSALFSLGLSRRR
jgi:uncharacterized membrane protein